MKQNGLDPAKPEDVEMQAQFDAQAPAYGVVADLWREAEEKHKADKERNANKHWNSYVSMGGGREMSVVTTSMNRHADNISHMTRFDLETMMDNAWNRVGSQITANCYNRLRQQYPGASEEELQATAYTSRWHVRCRTTPCTSMPFSRTRPKAHWNTSVVLSQT